MSDLLNQGCGDSWASSEMQNDVAVADSKARRFAGIYPGLAVDVLDGDGNAAAGDTKLGTGRDSYADE